MFYNSLEILSNVYIPCYFQETDTPELDLPDDEELAEAFDMHSLIISSLNTDEGHVVTADEVINEIESMMQVNALTNINFNLLTLF